jgi:hypothetical protein
VAAGRRRQRHRGEQDRRPLESGPKAEYTIIGGKRHETLTRRIQDMCTKAGRKARKVVEIKKPAVA